MGCRRDARGTTGEPARGTNGTAAIAAVINVLDVHNLEAGFEHHARGVEVGSGGRPAAATIEGPEG